MKEFVTAALPWVLVGIALAILAVNCGMEKQKDEKKSASITVGAGLGLLLGVALNSCGLWDNHALGLAIGPLWGMALAAMYRSKDTPKDENIDSIQQEKNWEDE